MKQENFVQRKKPVWNSQLWPEDKRRTCCFCCFGSHGTWALGSRVMWYVTSQSAAQVDDGSRRVRRQEAANQLETCGWPKMSSNVNKLRQRRLIWRGFSSSPRWDLQHSNPIFFFNQNSIKDGATVYKEINQWADGPVGELQAWATRWRTSCCHGNGRWVPCCPNQKRKLLTASWRFSPSFCPRRWREIGKFQLCGPAHHAELFGGEKKM